MADGKDDVDQWKELNEARKASIQRKLMVPLIYAPMLPLIRIGFNHNPTLRNRLYGASLIAALAHAVAARGRPGDTAGPRKPF